MSGEEEEHRLIVGVDYGTTFSGVAFGNTAHKSVDQIDIIDNWPGLGNGNRSKCPSQVAYGDGPKFPRGYRWGYEIQMGMPRLAWTKLLLDEDNKDVDSRASVASDESTLLGVDGDDISDWTDIHPDGFQQVVRNKDATEIITDYLTSLREHIMSRLERDIAKAVIDIMPIDWVLTVPAVWSDKAQAATKEAAISAGMCSRPRDRIFLLSEPEAAAVYTIAINQKLRVDVGGTRALRVNDHFVICDAGGGTVDLISYKVTSVEPTLKLGEAAVGSGGKCGSTFIDHAFQRLLEHRLGRQLYDSLTPQQKGAGSRLMEDFEKVKRSFGFDNDDDMFYIFIPCRDDPVAGISDGAIEISRDEIQQCFEPVVQKIISLIQRQVDQVLETGNPVKHILLVGGFGESEYLYKRLNRHWNDAGPIEIIKPKAAWTAVARGAVLRGLEGGMVVDRKCRRSYGTRINANFDPAIHSEDDAFYSTDTGLKMARNQVSWIVEKGTTTQVKTQFSLRCSTSFQHGEKLRRGFSLVASNADIPPTTYKDKNVYDVCFLMADLTMVPEEEFDECTMGGRTFLVAEFQVMMSFDSASIKFELQYKGKSYGSVKTKYH